MVVRIHVADRHGFQLRHAARRPFLLWDGRGRCVSQCIRGDCALDPHPTSRARLGHRLDDRSDWRYTAPFIPMLALLCLGAVLWLKLDPSRDIFEEEETTALSAAAVEPAV